MEQSLSYQQQMAVLTSFPDPVFLLAQDGLYVAIYGGTDSRYYHDGSGLIGKRISDVLLPEKAQWFLDEIAQALTKPGLHVVEYGLSARDIQGLDTPGPAEMIWFEGRVQKLDFLVDGQVVVLWVASNITHRIQVESQLTDALRREREVLDTLWKRIGSVNKMSVPSPAVNWTLNIIKSTLISAQGHAFALTANETALLHLLTQANGEVVDKEILVTQLSHGLNANQYNRIQVTLSRLRQKLVEHRCEVKIRSVFGKGLALVGALNLVE